MRVSVCGREAGVTADVVLRPMRWWDVEEVAAVEPLLFGGDAWSAETFWAELAAPGRWYVLATDGERLAGYAGVAVSGGEADVMTIAVHPKAQGRRTGSALLGALLDRARGSGAASVLLEVRADNAAALALYARYGFERIAVRRRYYQPEDVDAHVLRLRPLGPRQ